MKILSLFTPIVSLIILQIALSLIQNPVNTLVSGAVLIFCIFWFMVRLVVSFTRYDGISPEEIKLKYMVSGLTLKKLLVVGIVFILYMSIYQLYLNDPNTTALSPLLFFVVAEYGLIFLVIYATYLYEKRLILKKYSTSTQSVSSVSVDQIKKESSKSIWGFFIAIGTIIFGGLTSFLLYYGIKIFFFSCNGGLCSSEEIQKNLMIALFPGGILMIMILFMYAIFATGYFIFLFFCIKRYRANS